VPHLSPFFASEARQSLPLRPIQATCPVWQFDYLVANIVSKCNIYTLKFLDSRLI
jgi:hypothetical protein